MHISYKDHEGRPQQVQCEQIVTKSMGDFRNYMYCLTDELMKKVDIALSNQLGISTNVDTIGDLLEYIDDMIQRKIEVLKNREKEHTSKIVSETALHIRQSISEMMRESIKEATTVGETITTVSEPKVTPKTTIKKEETTPAPTVPKVTAPSDTTPKLDTSTVKIERTKTGRIRWTEDLMRAYCQDYDTLCVDAVVKKYGLTDRKTAVNYRCLFRSKLR